GLLNFTGNDFRISSILFPSIPGYNKKEDIIDYYCFDDKDRLWFSTRYQKLFCMDKGVIKNYSFLAGHTLNIYGVDYNFKKRRLTMAADTLKTGNDLSQQNFIAANSHQFILHPIMNHSFSNGMQIVSTRFDGSFLLDGKDNAIP